MELNTRPRKCLDYQTPFDLFMHELSLLQVSQYYLQFIKKKMELEDEEDQKMREWLE